MQLNTLKHTGPGFTQSRSDTTLRLGFTLKQTLLTILTLTLFALPLCGLDATAALAAVEWASEDAQAEFETDEDPYYCMYFGEEYDEDTESSGLLTVGTDISYTLKDEENPDEGLFITGKNANVQESYITIKKMFDFGTGKASRMKIDALAERTKKISMSIYLDNTADPIVTTQIKPQAAEDDWSNSGAQFIELSDLNITGEHFITITINDATTKAKKNTTSLLRSIKFYKESIPTVNINIDESLGTIDEMNSSKDHSVECYGNIDITVPDGFVSEYQTTDTAYTGGTYEMDYIRGRGNSTWTENKKPYKIKLADSTDLFGMGKNKHWALIANYYDPTLIKNRFTYYLGNAIGMEFTPQLVPVDVVMNGKYLGSYYLSEQVKVDKNRVAINDLEDYEEGGDMTGGYLLGLEPYEKDKDSSYWFTTDYKVNFILESPEEVSDAAGEGALDQMHEYISKYVNDTEAAIFGDDFKDANGKSYTEYMDVESAARYYIFQSLTLNVDAYGNSSTKLYKKENGKLYWGPLWDFDYVAWTYLANNGYVNYKGFGNAFPWFTRLLQDETFFNAVKTAWGGAGTEDQSSIYYQLNEIIKDGGIIDQYIDELKYSADNNYDLEDISFRNLQSYDEEDVNYSNIEDYLNEAESIKSWIKSRMDWYDANLDTAPDNDKPIKMIDISYYNGDELVTTVSQLNTEKLSNIPEAPTKEGYYFGGWYGNYPGYNDEGEEVMVTGKATTNLYLDDDTTFIAKWVAEDEVVKTEEIVTLADTYYIAPDGNINIPIELLPLAAADNEYTLTTDSDLISISDDGTIEGKGNTGTAEVTVKTIDGLTKTITIELINYFDEPETIELSTSEVELNVGDVSKLGITIDPESVKYTYLGTLNLNPEVAYISEAGVIHATKAGTTTIYVSYGGLNEYVPVTITVLGDSEETDPSTEGSVSPSPEASEPAETEGPAETRAASDESAAPSETGAASDESAAPAETGAASDESAAPSETGAASDESAAPAETGAASDESAAPAETGAASDESAAPAETGATSDESAAPAETGAASDESAAPSETGAASDESAAPSETEAASDESAAPSETEAASDESAAPSETEANESSAPSETEANESAAPSESGTPSDNKEPGDKPSGPSDKNTPAKVATSSSVTPAAVTSSAVSGSSLLIINKGATFTLKNLSYKVTKAGTVQDGMVKGGKVCVTGYLTINGKQIKKLTIPKTVTILDNVFKVKKINAKTFKDCKTLKKITFGKNVKKIGKKAFSGCKKLSGVIFKSKKCSFEKGAFDKISADATFTVPKSSLKAYKKALKKVGVSKSQIKGK
ncbi:MAG: CotH kinase family protein [Lachnospiraceae bacterium]|nr:CotH kinase family protein [Lachnospiraceae bacterium]